MSEIKQASVQDIHTLYQQKPADHVWIDVRQPEEWEEGTIPGTERIMLAELPDRIAELDKDKTYVMVCRSGGRSNRAAEHMAQEGFTKVINFNGGMLAWYAAGYETEA